jgi:hypothetical protein
MWQSGISLFKEGAGESGAVWNIQPFQIASLLEMLEHRANLFYTATRTLFREQLAVSAAIKERGGDALPTEAEAQSVRVVLKRLEAVLDPVEFWRAIERFDYFNASEPQLQPFARRGDPFTLSALKFELDELNSEIAAALGEKRFMRIPASDAGYYDNPELFGSEVAAKFPNANIEITEAGNCYATGNYTACVFHLMRAVEHGARAMVKGLRVSKKLKRKVELCDWGDLIGALESGLNAAAAGRRKSVAISNKSEFYNHAVGQFRNFKDAWRNNVSHVRTIYQEGQTKDIMNNTRQFMQHLATRVKE